MDTKKKKEFDKCKDIFLKQIMLCKNMHKDMTLAEFILHLMVNKSDKLQRFLFWDTLVSIIKKLNEIKICDCYQNTFLILFSNFSNHEEIKKNFITVFMKIAHTEKIWNSYYGLTKSKTRFFYKREQLYGGFDKDSIFYTFKTLINSHFDINNSNLYPFFNVLDSYIDKKWLELTLDDFKNIKKDINSKTYYIYIFKQLIEISPLSSERKQFLLESKYVNIVTTDIFKKDLWFCVTMKGGSERESEIDFSAIKHDIKGKEALKKFMKKKIDNKEADSVAICSRIINSLFEYLKVRNKTLKQFTSIEKDKFIDWLNLEYINKYSTGSTTNTGKSVKAFLVYTKNVYPEYLPDNLSLKGRVFSKRVENKKGIYTDDEIEKIELALSKYNKDDWFVDFSIMLMLTGKRVGEIINLDKNCIKKIDKYYYLEYIDSKSRIRKTFPLSSDENSKVEDEIFKANAYEVIKKIIERRIKNMPKPKFDFYSKKEDENKLFYIEMARSNKNGEKFRCLTLDMVSNAKNDFLIDNGLEEIDLDYSKFRNTIATKIIRAGYGEEAASKILGNLIKTVRYYYEGSILQSEILELDIDTAIDLKRDIESIQKMNQIPMFTNNIDTMYAVPGGFCEGGENTASTCKFYNRLFSNGGCLGCPTLCVTKENMYFYDDLHKRLQKELKSKRNSPFKGPIEDKIELVENTIKTIEKGNNNDIW